MYVNLSKLPSPPKTYQVYLRDLSGGVNYSKDPADILDNQCSFMENLLWENGCLRARKGMDAVATADENWSAGGNVPFEIFDRVWNGHVFMALSGGYHELRIAAYNINTNRYTTIYEKNDIDGIPNRGAFFRFGENLYFKCAGAYVCITYEKDTVSAADVAPYRPIIQINTSRNGVGDLYQPENRLNDEKEIWFNADPGVTVVELPADGETKDFYVGYATLQPESRWLSDGELLSVDEVYVSAALQKQADSPSAAGEFSVDVDKGKLTFFEAPPLGTKVTARVTLTARRYRLPDSLQGVEFVSVQVMGPDGYEEYSKAASGTIGDKEYGVASQGAQGIAPEIIFKKNLGNWNDAAGNANYIKVVYRLRNNEARMAIEDCYIATEYGSTGIETNCVVMAGCRRQPNAIFWSGAGTNGADPSYFPIDQYNIAGGYNDPITAFGRQQNKLVIFQTGRISSATYSLDYVDERLVASLPIRSINDRIGCDRPKTIQLIENNLVWFSTNHGVMYLKDSTYAYETLVVCISNNISRDIHDIRDNAVTSSFDDGRRYWLIVDRNAYVWDYSIQGYTANTERLRWFPQTGVEGIGWCVCGTKIYGCKNISVEDGKDNFLFEFESRHRDFGFPFTKYARLKTLVFGTHAYLKNVDTMIVALDGNAWSQAKVCYITDYDDARMDLSDIDTQREADAEQDVNPMAIRVRKPKCRHVHQFTVEFENGNETDLAIVSVQIFYTYRGDVNAGLKM